MSAFFNLLLFVGVFYLILLAPEPGDWRTNRAGDEGQPSRKAA